MADLEGRYPFSTADGKAIPLDIVRPYGSMKKSFAVESSTAAIVVPDTIEVLAVMANEDCIIQFAASSASASAFTDGVLKEDSFFIAADLLTVVSPPLGKKSFALIGDSASGIAIIQFLQKWAGLSLASQINKR